MAAKRLGLLIATTGYADPRLPSVSDDVADLKDLVETLREVGGFSITALFDPTLEAARSAIAGLLANREPDGLVLLYFAGHLIKQADDTLFLALRETVLPDLGSTALAAAPLQQQLRETAAHNQIIILDGRLGSIASSEMLVERDLPQDVGSKFYVPNRDQAILARSDYLSFCFGERYVELRAGKPLLAESIVRGLRRTADEGADRQVTMNELLGYLHKARESVREDEIVAKWVSARAGEFVLAAYPKTGIDQAPERSTAEPDLPPSTQGNRPSPLDENVTFTAYRPAVMRPEQWRRMIVFMHLNDDLALLDPDQTSTSEEVEIRARQILGAEYDDYRNVVGESRFPIVRESEIVLVPEVPGIQFNPPRRSFLWATGLRVHEESFFMRAPFALAGKVARGRVSIFFGQLLLAEIALSLRVAEESVRIPLSKEEGWARSVAKPFRKIFASYSHQDATVVEAMERNIRAIGYEYLRDVVNLRSGQHWDDQLLALITDADIFQLFWSRNSAQSAHVEKEWRYAIALQREAFVRPAYWEIPMPEAPEPLRRLHFYLLPGIQPADRKKGEDSDQAASTGDKRSTADRSATLIAGPPKGSSTLSKSEADLTRKPRAPVPPHLLDETPSDDAAQLNLPLAGNRPPADSSLRSERVERPKGGKTKVLRWGAIFGTLIGACFAVFLSINLLTRSSTTASRTNFVTTPTPSSTAAPLPTVRVPILTMPTPTPTEPVVTLTPTQSPAAPTPAEPVGTPTPTQPVVTLTPTQPSATPAPTEPLETPMPTEPLVAPTPTQPLETPTPTEPLVAPTPTQPLATPMPTEPLVAPKPTQPLATPTPTEPLVTPTPTQPLATPIPEPSATPSPEEPSVNPSPGPTVTPSPGQESGSIAHPSPHHRHHHRHHKQ